MKEIDSIIAKKSTNDDFIKAIKKKYMSHETDYVSTSSKLTSRGNNIKQQQAVNVKSF
jgi:hypothetical protein